MPQQINLYSPILLAPRRLFSARAMVQALGALILGLGALAGWSLHAASGLRHDLAALGAVDAREQARLEAELASRPRRDPAALAQEAAAARKALDERRALLAELEGSGSAAARLDAIAATLPASAWLTDVALGAGRVEIAGMTLEPQALQAWIATLSAQRAFGGLALAALKVERGESTAGAAWSFRIVGTAGGSGG
jgi:Tfp pilus assembly protein PilN